MALAVHARLWLIPSLGLATLPKLAWPILGGVTLFSVLFAVAGVAFRTRGFW